MSLCSAVLLAACGGSGGGAGAPTGGGAAPSTTLSISPSSLVLSVNDTVTSAALTGNSRIFTVTNTGSVTAQSVIWAVSTGSPALPSGTNLSTTCAALAPGASCTITVTPGNAPSAAQGVTNPAPVTLSVGGSNTNLLSPNIQVLRYGSVYQGGYVFAIDDTTPNTGNVGGKVAALADEVTNVPWGAGAGGAPAFVDIAGVSENAVAPCAGNVDGACNTQEIVNGHTLATPSEFAAGACSASVRNGYTDWYLPAICEMGTSGAVVCPAGQQSMQANLIDNSTVGGLPPNYWSSTQYSADPANRAWVQQFALGGGNQFFAIKGSSLPARCVRALTL